MVDMHNRENGDMKRGKNTSGRKEASTTFREGREMRVGREGDLFFWGKGWEPAAAGQL
jgi:hypothetical protein